MEAIGWVDLVCRCHGMQSTITTVPIMPLKISTIVLQTWVFISVKNKTFHIKVSDREKKVTKSTISYEEILNLTC